MGMTQALPVPDKSLFFTCRMCVRMAEQWEKGEKVCHLKCGGPRKGLTFPQYAGPLTATYLRDHCFVCGSPAEMRVAVKTEGLPNLQELGICMRHLIFVGTNADELKAKPEPDQLGIVQSTKIVPVDIYTLTGIDPVKDLGFEPEKKEGENAGT